MLLVMRIVSGIVSFIMMFSPFGIFGNKGNADQGGKELNLLVALDGSGDYTTIDDAKNYIRTVDKTKYAGINVSIKSGEYVIGNEIKFTAEDSGSAECPIRYIGEDGATVIGGIVLSSSDFGKAEGGLVDYFPDDVKDKIVSVDLTKYGYTGDAIKKLYEAHNYFSVIPFLSVNGERQTIAQFPDDWMHIEELVINSEDGTFRTAEDLVTTETVTYDPQYAETVQSWSEIIPVYIRARFTKLWCPDDSRVVSIDKNSNKFDALFGGGYGYEKGTVMYFYNVPEALDKPGEYIIDDNAILYYYPTDEFEDGRITLPLSDGLVNAEDVDYITFENIGFTSSHKNGLILKGDHVSVIGCEVSSIVDTGIIIEGEGNLVENCKIFNIGDCGIRVTSGDVRTATGEPTLITENDIYETATTNAYGGAIVAHGVNITISHNDCHDSNFKAISLDNSVNCTIEYNDVWNMLLLADDVGVISVDGIMNANVVFRYNYVHEIGSVGEPSKIKDYNPDYEYFGADAFYFDNGCSYIETYGNIVKSCDTGYLSNGGRGNSCHGNIFIDCSMWYVWFSEWMYANNRDADGNIHGSIYVEDYAYTDVWKKMNPDLSSIITNAEGQDPNDPMLWCAPAKCTCHDNFIAYNKGNRYITNWGIKPFYIEGAAELFSGEGLKYDKLPQYTYNSKKEDVDVLDVIEKASGIADMTVERFETIGRTGK